MTYGAERWNTVRCATRSTISGTNWIALAPVPTTATRRPVRSRSCRHCAEWKTSPAKWSSPGRSGTDGVLSCPHAVTRTSAVWVPPPDSCSVHAPALLVEGRREHLGREAHARCDAVLLRDPAEVGVDLGLPGEPPRPPVLGREGERVQVARDVAGRPRVGVLAPDPADVVAALEQHEVGDPRLEQLHGRADAAEAGPHDRHAGHGPHPARPRPAAREVPPGQLLDTSGQTAGVDPGERRSAASVLLLARLGAERGATTGLLAGPG